ncbi:MAG: Xaa-Pro peptidase family protein [Candidatus Micrarchaeota archaeon]
MMQSRVSSFFRRNRVDSFIIQSSETTGANFAYLSGLELDNSVLLARRDGETLLLVNRINGEEAKAKSDVDVSVWKNKRDFWNTVLAFTKGCRSIGFDGSFLTAASYIQLKKRMKGKSLTDISKELSTQRGVKNSREISIMRKSARIARSIINELAIEVGKSELDIAKELRLLSVEKGVEPSFEPIVLSGKNTAMPHGKPSKKKLSPGDVTLVDFGVRYNGYCSDISRCFFLGKCPDELKAYQSLKQVLKRALGEMREGARCSDIPKYFDGYLKEAGLEAMIHAPGHGIGLQVHESPHLGKASKDIISNGMTLALEPAYYGKYGVRYEDDIVVVGGRLRIL